MDYTIEVWTVASNHYADCTCGWKYASSYQSVIETMVKNHRFRHSQKSDSTEIV